MTIRKFNTTRPYTEAGQRIAYTELPDHRVYFVDIDRGIDGTIPAPTFDWIEVNNQYVLDEYDHNNYQYDAEVRREWFSPLSATARN